LDSTRNANTGRPHTCEKRKIAQNNIKKKKERNHIKARSMTGQGKGKNGQRPIGRQKQKPGKPKHSESRAKPNTAQDAHGSLASNILSLLPALQALPARACSSPRCGSVATHQTGLPDAWGPTPRSVQGNTQAVDKARTGRGRCLVPRVKLIRRASVSAEEFHHVVASRSTTGKDRGPESVPPFGTGQAWSASYWRWATQISQR